MAKTEKSGSSDRDESLIARENWERYQYGIARGHRDYTGLAARLEGYYLGGDRDGDGRLMGNGQWSDEDLGVLRDQGRPAYEFNEIKPAIEAACGYQIQNRMDIAFRPRGGDATKELAEVRSKVAMQIADNNKLHWLESEVFEDGMVQQRGYFDFRMDFDDSTYGELKVTSLDPMDVMPDPDAKSYEPSGWSDVVVTRWLTLAEIEGIYGKKARKKAEDARSHYLNEQDFGDGDSDGEERSKFSRGNKYGYFDAEYNGSGDRRLRIIDRQRWVREIADVAVMPGGDVRLISGDETPAVLEHMAAAGAQFTKRRMRRVRWTVSTVDTLLHDDWSPYDRFTVVPFFPIFRRGRTRGMVDNGMDPQNALNKAVSQYIHIINTTANSGWQVEEDQLTNMTTEELEESGSRTGLVVERKKGTAPLTKIQPNQVPPGVDKLIDRAAMTLKEVTVPDAMRGVQGREESGIAIQSKQHAAQQSLAGPLDKLARTRSMCASWIDYAISKYYDSERVFRITKTDPKTGKEGEESLVINAFDPTTGSYMNDMTAGEYDVIITEQPMQVTFENGQFQQALEMRTAGIGIPDSVMVRHSNLTDKHEVIAQMEAAQQPAQDPLIEAELALRQARAALANAQAARAAAEAVTSGVTGMYSATQAAGAIAANPAVAPLADGLLKSAGFKDQDVAPIVPGGDGSIVPGMEQAMTGAAPAAGMDVQQNTSPMHPPVAAPDTPELPAAALMQQAPSPAQGAMDGIETQEFES